jgi:anaerobic selenocysteine-containing dehydrogenase
MYKKNNCVFHYELPKSYQYMRNWNKGYLEWSQRNRITRYAEPILIHLYSEVLQRFRPRRRARASRASRRKHLKKRVETYFDPLPFYYDPLEAQVTDKHQYPLAAVTQRPMAMYHSWDSQNAWLRQIHTHNYLYVNARTARCRASKTATGSGSSRSGARCAAWRAIPRRWSRARCGPGTPSARRPGPGT